MQLEKEAFKNWLKSKSPNEHAGMSSSLYNCPIANFLRETGQLINPVVCESHFRECSVLWETVRTPSWAAKFIRVIDGPLGTRFVTVNQALEVLDKLED